MGLFLAWIEGLESDLPAWFGQASIQWLPWAYAIWQLMRKNQWILLCLSFPTTLVTFIWAFCRHGDFLAVELIPLSSEESSVREAHTYEDSDAYFTENPPKAFKSVERRSSWPAEWRAVSFNGRIYFTTKTCLDIFATVFNTCGAGNYTIFVEPSPRMSLPIGQWISRDDAYEKILGGDYMLRPKRPPTDGEDGQVQDLFGWISWTSFLDVNRTWWGVLSAVPTLLQAANYNRTSTFLVFIIIFIDVNRVRFQSAYEYIFLKLRVFVKTWMPEDALWNGYVYFGLYLFSRRWRPGEVFREGEEIKMNVFSRVERLEDVEFVEGGDGECEWYAYQCNGEGRVYRILGDRGEEILPIPQPPIKYALVILRRPLPMELRKGQSDLW